MAGPPIDLADDFRDLLRAFVDADVRFLVVGAYALAVLGRPRATGDLDLWIEATPDNATRAHRALRDFGAPVHELTEKDLVTPGTVFQVGLPPLRIDILTAIDAVDFAEAWPRREQGSFDGVEVPVIGRSDFIRNKRATGRLKDLADVESLEGPSAEKPSRSPGSPSRRPRRPT